jgi:hypothetical protein
LIIQMLLRHFGTTLHFYAASAVVILVCGVLGYAALFGFRGIPLADQPILAVPLAAVVGGAGCLIYARLLGRLAFIASQSDGGRRRKHGVEWPEEADRVESFDPWSPPHEGHPVVEPPGPHGRPRKALPQKKKLRAKKTNQAFDPWAIPADEPIRKKTKPTPSSANLPEDPYGPAEGTYEVLPEDAAPSGPPLSPGHPRLEKEDADPYAVSPSPEAAPGNLPPVHTEVSKLEEELAAPRCLPPLPQWPLLTGVYSFPFYQQTVGPCGTLMLGFVGLLGLVRILFFVFPF